MPASPDHLRTELAVAAARLIAEEGCDYGQAKRRAVRELLGEGPDARGILPDNTEIERELRRHLRLFAAETHPRLITALRRTAVNLMERLAEFRPHLVGAVLNGTATEHSNIELHLYTDSAKDVEVFLMNTGIDFMADEGGDRAPAAQERLSFVTPLDGPNQGRDRPRVGVQLHVFETDAIRVAPRYRTQLDDEFDLHPVAASGRASLASLRELLRDSTP
jgi:hypothetical protein